MQQITRRLMSVNSYDVEFADSSVQSTTVVMLSAELAVHESAPLSRRISMPLTPLSESLKPVHHAVSLSALDEYNTSCEK